ncbi:MAG: response regulator [Candidatus Omnitrophica bacterium]|nr:response regulator [Candidatus Omnitrophota bacterium]
MSNQKIHRILLVDDDKDMCESLRDVIMLTPGYAVDYFIDPFQAIETIKAADYDLIIIDYKMPEMNGVELLAHIRESHPEVPVIMLTAFISNDLIQQAKDAGATKVLSKVLWPSDLLEQINSSIK